MTVTHRSVGAHTHTRKHIHCLPHVERLCVRCVNILWALWRLLLLCPTQAKHPDWQPSQNVISSGFYIAKWKLCELLLSNVRQHFRAPHFNYRRRQLSLGNAIRLHAMWPLSNGNLLSVLYTIDITNPHYKHRQGERESETRGYAYHHTCCYPLSQIFIVICWHSGRMRNFNLHIELLGSFM